MHTSNEKIAKILSLNGNLIQGVGDNFYCTINSQYGLKQTHSMALILTQQEASLNPSLQTPGVIKRVNRTELSGVKLNETEVTWYRGPPNPPMPSEEALYQVMPLTFLAHKAISVDIAKYQDSIFLHSILNEEATHEYNRFNKQLMREAGNHCQAATKICYLPIIDLNPAHPDTVLTSMREVKRITEDANQMYTVYTNDQQLYKISVQICWFNRDEFKLFISRLAGMHTLMPFIGYVGILMANNGLEEIMSKAFAGVKKMLAGKKFPQNMRALRMVAEECIRAAMITLI